jgi:hypothetical protein
MQFPVPGMPASRRQDITSLWLFFMSARRWQTFSGETPEFRALEFYCIIWDEYVTSVLISVAICFFCAFGVLRWPSF